LLLALIQARLSSRRLPGKVLAPVLGVPMLGRQLERVARAGVDRVIVATSEDAGDAPIDEFVRGAGYACFRGSLSDVLDRMYQAARAYGADQIIRLTADCPLVHRRVIDDVVSRHRAGGFDYTSNTLRRTHPHGVDVEIMTFAALERAWCEAKAPAAREHVTTYILSHPESFRLGSVEHAQDWSHYRWTVDYAEDLEAVRAIFDELYPLDPDFSIEQIVTLYERRPELWDLNAAHNVPVDDAVEGARKLIGPGGA
jgi:spore coat polysaccharide biosynthesis protein SpsF